MKIIFLIILCISVFFLIDVNAVYFTTNSSSTDGVIRDGNDANCDQTIWNTVHDSTGSGGVENIVDDTSASMQEFSHYACSVAGAYFRRAFLPFNITDIPSSAIINEINITVFESGTSSRYAYLLNSTWDGITPLTKQDFDSFQDAPNGNYVSRVEFQGINENKVTFNINDTANISNILDISGGGSRHVTVTILIDNDYLDIFGVDSNSLGAFFSEDTGNRRPFIEIDYSINNEPDIISNITIPETPIYGDIVFINANVTDSNLDDMFAFNTTIVAPNGSIIMDNINGTIDEKWKDYSYNVSSIPFIIDDAGTWLWYFNVSDNSSGAINTSFGRFTITDTVLPTIVSIDSPINNSHNLESSLDINYSITDDMRVDRIWYELINISGQVLTSNVSGTSCNDLKCGQNFSQVFFPLESEIHLFVYANDTSGNEISELVNLSIGVDSSIPTVLITEPTGTKTSREVIGNFTISDNAEVINSTYDVFVTSTGVSVFSNPNITIDNPSTNQSVAFNTGSDSDFTFIIYATDIGNNIGVNQSNFTVSPSVGGGDVIVAGSGGGGSAEELVCNREDINWIIRPRSFNLLIGKNTFREKTLEIVNNGTNPINFEVNCDDTSENTTLNACQFVNISESRFTIPPNIEEIKLFKIQVESPENISFGESFSFGLFFEDQVSSCPSTVSAKVTASIIFGSFAKLVRSTSILGVNFPIFPIYLILLIIPVILGLIFNKLFSPFISILGILIGLGGSFLFLLFI